MISRSPHFNTESEMTQVGLTNEKVMKSDLKTETRSRPIRSNRSQTMIAYNLVNLGTSLPKEITPTK
jgi:hypothetical protein